MEPIEERMYMSKTSHLVVPRHQTPPIWIEEAAGLHKRVKRLHDPVKIVVPCTVFEAESPIPPDRRPRRCNINRHRPDTIERLQQAGIDQHYHFIVDRVSEQKEFDVCGNLRDVDTTTRSDKSGGKRRRKWKKRKRIKGGPQVSLTPHFSDCVRKSRVLSRCFSHPFAKLRALLLAEIIDKEEKSMEEAFTQE
uniref:Uncharacterized protein n=1 Tax=Brassica oleracea var. oleracea TaxID=109376 RepID=A0A0D3D2W0_BRAOL